MAYIISKAYKARLDRLLNWAERRMRTDRNRDPWHYKQILPETGRRFIKVRNDSGADREKFEILGLDGPVYDPDDEDELSDFKARITWKGVTPDETKHLWHGYFCVLQQAIESGAKGDAMIAGETLCKVQTYQAEGWQHRHATIEDGQTAHLVSAPWGAAQIMWYNNEAEAISLGGEETWALVRLTGPDDGVRISNESTNTLPAYGVFPGHLTYENKNGYGSVRVDRYYTLCNEYRLWINGPVSFASSAAYADHYSYARAALDAPVLALIDGDLDHDVKYSLGLMPEDVGGGRELNYKLAPGFPGFRAYDLSPSGCPANTAYVLRDLETQYWFAVATSKPVGPDSDGLVYVTANPTVDAAATHTYDGTGNYDTISIRVYWLCNTGTFPNVQIGDVIRYTLGSMEGLTQGPEGGVWGHGEVIDRPSNVVTLWSGTTSNIPPGYRKQTFSTGWYYIERFE